MARNEEKALTLFNRWQTFKKDFHSDASNRRPLLASECNSLGDSEKWRREIIRDITKKISAIHNATLGEHRIRELNDEINKLMKQKHFWDKRIRELGGDANRSRQFYDIEGKELPGVPGYKYYGAAKDLPGVRQLFEEHDNDIEKQKKRRSRADIYRNITPDYYGFRDEDDGVLLIKEAEMEKRKFAEAMDIYESKRARLVEDLKSKQKHELTPAELALLEDKDDDEEEKDLDVYISLDGVDGVHESSSSKTMMSGYDFTSRVRSTMEDSEGLTATVSVPSQDEITQIIVESKKKMLLQQFTL